MNFDFTLVKSKSLIQKALASINKAIHALEFDDYVTAGEGTYEAEKFSREASEAILLFLKKANEQAAKEYRRTRR